jgi:hypothetical protein
MNAAADFAQNARLASELATLSRDPALTFRPDPAFRMKFRNADEIMEGDFNALDTGTRHVLVTPQPWADAVSLRRSPKE